MKLCGGSLLGGDHGLDVVVASAETTAEEIQHLAQLGDGWPNVAVFIREALELCEAFVDQHVALLSGPQFGHWIDSRYSSLLSKRPLMVYYRVKVVRCD